MVSQSRCWEAHSTCVMNHTRCNTTFCITYDDQGSIEYCFILDKMITFMLDSHGSRIICRSGNLEKPVYFKVATSIFGTWHILNVFLCSTAHPFYLFANCWWPHDLAVPKYHPNSKMLRRSHHFSKNQNPRCHHHHICLLPSKREHMRESQSHRYKGGGGGRHMKRTYRLAYHDVFLYNLGFSEKGRPVFTQGLRRGVRRTSWWGHGENLQNCDALARFKFEKPNPPRVRIGRSQQQKVREKCYPDPY